MKNENEIYCFEISPVNEIYYNEDSMYGVYSFNTRDSIPYTKSYPFDEELYTGTITGKMQQLSIGLKYDCRATSVYNKKYKRYQYEIIDATPKRISSEEEQKEFLKCILTARQVDALVSVYPKIVDMIINEEEIDLSKVKGVKEKSFNKIKDKILENYVLSDIIRMLKPYGVTIDAIKRLMKNEKSVAILKKKLEENPYKLTEIKGFGFNRVDKIALQINPKLRLSEYRVRSFLTYTLKQIGSNEGHSRVDLIELDNIVKKNIKECYNIYNEIVEKEIKRPRQLYISFDNNEEGEVGLLKYYEIEKSILDKLNSIEFCNSYTVDDEKINNASKDFFKNKGYNLTEHQKEVMYSLQSNNVVILTGKSGTGKSSCIDAVLRAFDDKKIEMCALSAKASRRMVETTGREAKTIHRLLKFNGNEFEYNKTNPLQADLVIVDEASMINSSIFLNLLNAIDYCTKILIVFDDGQLPPIGVGNIATDLLLSKFKHVHLDEVHRQALDSGILVDANTIRDGINPIEKPKPNIIRGNLKDMFYSFKTDKEDIFNMAIQYYLKSLNKLDVMDVSICVPRKESSINCTENLNNRIQELLLSNESKKIERGNKLFKLGAKVIQKSNNYEKDVVNGEMGIITNINNKEDFIEVTFDKDKKVVYEGKELTELDLAYALTTHSMQGSECNTVIVVLDMNSYILLSRELIYTAITRAKKRCLVIAEPKAFNLGIKKKSNKRNTWLQLLLNK